MMLVLGGGGGEAEEAAIRASTGTSCDSPGDASSGLAMRSPPCDCESDKSWSMA